MSTRPSTVFQFDTNETNSTPIAAGRITDGYPFKSPLPSTDLNYCLNLLGKWNKYFADGDVSLNDLVTNGLILKGVKTLALATGNNDNVDVDGTTHNVGACYIDVSWSGSTSPASARFITGFANPVDGRILILHNKEASTSWSSHRVALLHDASSTAANRIYLPNNAAGLRVTASVTTAVKGLVIPPDGIVILRYDGADQRWIVIGSSFPIRQQPKQLAVPLFPGLSFSNIAAGTISGVNNMKLVSSGAWSYYGTTLPGLSPGDVIVGYSMYFKQASSGTTVTLAQLVGGTLDQTTLTANVAAATSGGVAQEYIETNLAWSIQDLCSYFVKLAGANSSEEVYDLELQIASPNG